MERNEQGQIVAKADGRIRANRVPAMPSRFAGGSEAARTTDAVLSR
jgi:hypothetical protein